MSVHPEPSGGDAAGQERPAAAVPHASESRYRTLFEYAPVGILYADAESYYLDANNRMCQMLGYARAEIIGMHASDIVAPGETPHVGRALNEIHGGTGHEREWQFRRKDGTVFNAEVIATKFADGTLLGMVQDVSQLRAHERELDRMTRLYDALSQVNQAIVWSKDRGALFEKVCQVLVERGGLKMAWIGWHDPEARQLIPVAECGDTNGDLKRVSIYTDDRPEGRGPAGTAFKTGQSYVCNDLLSDPATLPWRAAMDRGGYLSCAAFPIRLGGAGRGTLVVYAGTAHFFHDREIGLLEEAATDVSFALDNFARDESRREAEALLRDEIAFSDALIESMPGILYIYDTEGRFLRWNRNFETVSGYSAEAIDRMHPRDFFPEADRRRLEHRVAAVFETGEATLEADFLSRDGRTTPYLFTGRRVDFLGRTSLVGVGIDMTERNRAEQALRDSEHRFRSTLDGILEGCQLIGFDWRYLYLNHAAAVHNRRPNEELIGQEYVSMWPGVEHTPSYGLMRRVMEERVALHDEMEFEFPDGTKGWFDLRVEPVPEGILILSIDITDRVRIEAERERRHRAEAADRIKSAFLATMSHELRTPLNSIIGFTGIVLQGLAGPLNEEQGKQLDMVRTSARHLLALVNDVLDISKIEAGQFEVARQPFELPRSVDKVASIVAPQVEAKGLAFRVSVAPEIGTIVGDERRFEQVLLNLVGNAIKFTDAGEISIDATYLPEYRASDAPDPHPAVCLRVSDTGIGIKSEDMLELFQPFRQIDSGLSRLHEGTGLGLAICLRLTELMGGDIHVESEWGSGTTFTVTLPQKGPVPA